MHTLHPVTVRVGINSFFSLSTTVIPPFLGTTCTGLTHALSEIGYISPASSSLITSVFTTSFMFGFSLLWGCITGWCPSSIKILCVQKDGFIPLISEIFHAIASLYFVSISNSFSFSIVVSSADIITGSLEPFSRKAYSRLFGRGFSSKVGGSSTDGFMFGVEVLSISSYVILFLSLSK